VCEVNMICKKAVLIRFKEAVFRWAHLYCWTRAGYSDYSFRRNSRPSSGLI